MSCCIYCAAVIGNIARTIARLPGQEGINCFFPLLEEGLLQEINLAGVGGFNTDWLRSLHVRCLYRRIMQINTVRVMSLTDSAYHYGEEPFAGNSFPGTVFTADVKAMIFFGNLPKTL